MNATELAKRFLDSFRLHEVMDGEEELNFSLPMGATDPFEAAMPIISAQASERAIRDLEWFTSQDPGAELLKNEERFGLLLALFITARDKGGDVQLRNGSAVIGDHMNDMTEVCIEVAARRSDFIIDFLITRNDIGPHPDWYVGADDTVPHTLETRHELALIRDDGRSGQPHPSDRKTRRGGLASLGLLVLPYDIRDAERDPFGIASRAIDDLERAFLDTLTP